MWYKRKGGWLMENLSRSELEKKIGGLEAQIAELQNAALKGK